MVAELNSERLCRLADDLDIVECVLIIGCTGAKLAGKRGYSNIFTSDGSVLTQHSMRIFDHVHKGNVSRYRNKSDILAHIADILRGDIVKTRELNAVIAHCLYRLESALKVCFGVFANGINLNCYRERHKLYLRNN